jgi:type VI secretion system VasD/TssJ family lipoprotein
MVLAPFTAAACSHTPTPREPETCPEVGWLRVMLDGAKNLNPDPNGDPLTTVVRVYQLKGVSKIELATMQDLMRNEKEALADELVDAVEVTLKPGGTEFPRMERKPETTHLAVAAFFRQPNLSSFRAITPLPPSDPLYCHGDKDRHVWMHFFFHTYQVQYVP